MSRTKIIATNAFHNTQIAVYIDDANMPADNELGAECLSDSQRRRVHDALCGQGTWKHPRCACVTRYKVADEQSFDAGVFGGGGVPICWSTHSSVALAEKAALRYARKLAKDGPKTGDSLAWSAWFWDGVKRVVVE